MDSSATEPKQSVNVSLPIHLFHQMAACFYGDGPTFAQLMGFDDPQDFSGPGPDAADSDTDDMDDQAVVVVPKLKVHSSGNTSVRGDDDGAS